MSTPVRSIAVVLDGPPTPAWQARALQALQRSPSLHVVEVRLVAGERPGLARRLHAALERRVVHPGADALAPTAVDGLALDEAAGGQPAQLVLWLAQGPALVAEDRDVLHLRHGRRQESIDEAFKRAVIGRSATVETEALLSSAGETVVVERTVSEVRPFSATLGRNYALWKLVELVRRAAERAPGLALPEPPPKAEARAPSDAALIVRAIVTWPRVILTRLMFRRPWSVRVRRRAEHATVGWSRVEEERVRWAPDHVYADPFLFEHDGRHHLFCEEIARGGDRAVISHTELPLDGAPAQRPSCVLDRPYHLSYPFLFAHEGETFMIPETSSIGRVELYRATAFPHSWEHEAVLLDGIDAADATVLAHDDRLWLFAAIAADGASSLDELHLFWASAPRGPWHAHPLNPVVSDARCARPAGAIQRWGPRLVRPGQDGSRRYGGAVAFCEIDVLNEREYAEHEVERLEGADVRGARATHTYSSDRAFEAIDLRRRELRLRGWLGRRRS